MKKFNEWREESNQHENPDLLVSNINHLVDLLKNELEAFEGDRFEGFLNIIGGVKQLQRTLAEIDNNCVNDTPKYITSEDCGEPHKSRAMKKIKHREVVSKGVRHGDKDLSKDYKGHIGKNGDEQPFKVMKK